MKECNIIKQSPIAALAAYGGGAGGTTFTGGSSEASLYVDDLFGTYLYDGTGAAQTITNGIDLSGEGGMVWTKSRSLSEANMVFDTERGVQKRIFTNSTTAESTSSNTLTAFNSNGFTIGDNNIFNTNNSTNCSWSFRKAPGFFDVVKYTGNGSSSRNIAHNLGSTPGMIIVKNLDATSDWYVWHTSLPFSYQDYLKLNSNAAKNVTASGSYDSAIWAGNNPTSTVFSVGSSLTNTNSNEYIAYVFANNDASFGENADESIIKCGTYEGSGNTKEVNLGFEFQWLLIKNVDSASDSYGNADWTVVDNMREASTERSRLLYSNLANAEGNGGRIVPTPTGFKIDTESNIDYNASGDTYIYVAIRRPHKPPEAATGVFAIDNQGTGTMPPQYHSGFPVDWAFQVAFAESQTYRDRDAFTRLLGRNRLQLNETTAETSFSSAGMDYMDGYHDNNSSVSTTYSWMFKRAPGFFDVVAYEGNGTTNNQTHNLGAVPELMIFKNRDAAVNWMVWFGDGSNVLYLNTTNAKVDEGLNLNSTTSTNIPIANSNSGFNNSGVDYVVFLFATLSGISKVGTYTGTGYDINVDCGFTAGARFILIKRTDSTGDWYVWDSTRGIVSGNDPYFLLNTDDADVTNTDYVDPLNAGFTVTSSAPAALNTSGGTYLFLAVA